MESVEVLEIGVDAVAGKAAAETVGTVVHGGDRVDHTLTAHSLTAPVDDAGDGATGGVSELTFFE